MRGSQISWEVFQDIWSSSFRMSSCGLTKLCYCKNFDALEDMKRWNFIRSKLVRPIWKLKTDFAADGWISWPPGRGSEKPMGPSAVWATIQLPRRSLFAQVCSLTGVLYFRAGTPFGQPFWISQLPIIFGKCISKLARMSLLASLDSAMG